MYWISIIAAPFIWLLTLTSDFIIKLFRIKPNAASKVTEEEIKAIIQEGTTGGAIHKIEQDIMERVISLGDRKVASLMTNRNDTIFLKTTFDADEINKTVNSAMHSVYPVANNKMDVVGIILLKDLFKHIKEPNFKIADHLKPPQYLAENISAYEALQIFKAGKMHQAIVMDEYGQMQGMVTMNDLLEALVGDVSDFYGSEISFIKREDGSWFVDGQYPLIELLRKFALGYLAEAYPFNTISGLIINELRRIPSAGDTLQWLDFEIEILDMDGARIDKVLLTKKDKN
jgi:putative hemolysin